MKPIEAHNLRKVYINEDIETVALEEDSEKKFKERQDIARQNSWEIKVENQLKLIKDFLSLTA